MIYAFLCYKSGLWDVLTEDGVLMKHHFYSSKKANEMLPQWYEGVMIVKNPWDNLGVINAKKMYEQRYGCSYDGRC